MNRGMLKLFRFLILLLLVSSLNAQNIFDFNIIKKGQENNNTLLVIGGIQGDEPGGFMSASLLTTHYDITKGSVWIVPNLNFYSIIKRSRGPYGDMNRKFAKLSKNDPEYKTVERIKNHIRDEQVKLVVNLHDGSGYYRKTYIDNLHSPYRWGQCSIIDQTNVNVKKYGNLEEISSKVVKHVNKYLLKQEDIYNVHNTKTKDGDKEMEKTLTYFAINNGKAAFGNEASKSLPTHKRVYYHLLALEKYMDIMGIEYKRKFTLSSLGVYNALNNDIYISLYDNKITLPLSQIRNILKYVPLKDDDIVDFKASNPLLTIYKKDSSFVVQYGNRRLTRLKAQYKDHDNLDLNQIKVNFNIDSKDKSIPFGSIVEVKNNFIVEDSENYRVNVIGFTNKNKKETGVKILKSNIAKRFSIDKRGRIYRVEYYTKGIDNSDKFAGMVLVKFKS
ncbi:MAG: M99 family carboxypeptidase catalytic domain-containing protein [Campylobacterota bacterium]|nr:M99 family carboxypeptidase catalytic domain-containing protein [Campylobacterota bacterium]